MGGGGRYHTYEVQTTKPRNIIDRVETFRGQVRSVEAARQIQRESAPRISVQYLMGCP